MYLDFATTPARDRYKLLIGLVVPRPIALVTSRGADGLVNAAPFSFFNVFSQDPPVCVLGIETRTEAVPKDTARNIERTGELVVNLVDETIAEAMNVCAIDFPPDMSEIEPAGFTLSPSTRVDVPRLTQAPAALECRNHTTLILGTARRLIVAEILAVHLRDDIVDAERMHVIHDRYRPIGRLAGNDYCRTGDTFTMQRRTFAEWSSDRDNE